MQSESNQYSGTYIHFPTIPISIEIVPDINLNLCGIIDTGSSYTLVAEEIIEKYYKISELKPNQIWSINGCSEIRQIKTVRIQISGYHQVNKGFEIEVFSLKLPTIRGDQKNVGVILGLSFLEKCRSFWIDAHSKKFHLEFGT